MKPPIPTPKACNLIKDKVYAYCTCNKSEEKPFCDGSHKKLTQQIKPLLFKALENKKEFLCTCGASKNEPYCDGSH